MIYKRGIAEPDADKEKEAKMALNAINEYLEGSEFEKWDIGILARNFFAAKIFDYNNQSIGAL